MFRPGQHVKLVSHPWNRNPANKGVPVPADCPLQLGDRFTVLKYHSGFDNVEELSHKDGSESVYCSFYLEEIKYNAEPKGVPRAHKDTLDALGMVLQNGPLQNAAMEEVKLDLERARMEREDFRQGKGPAFSETMTPQYMTAELRIERTEEELHHMTTEYNCAETALDEVRDILESKRRRKVSEAIKRINEEIGEPGEFSESED